jgi:DnaD/phage-associated family protein
MMTFDGFPSGKVRLTPIPAPFFSELLPAINHLGELKVTLYAFWRLDRMEGAFRYLRRADFTEDKRFIQGMGDTPQEAEAALTEALARAVGRGAFLEASIQSEGGNQTLYFLNTPKGRAAVEAIRAGEWQPAGQAQMPAEFEHDRPNIYRLYEEHIGPLSPMIAETLREAEAEYPDHWIRDAVRIAIENNKRNWRYVAAILRRWQEKGRDEVKDRRDTEKARRRYAAWEDEG